MKINISCFCGANIPFEYDEEADIDENSGHLTKMMEGVFMSVNCPSCGKKHKPEFRITVIWKSKNLRMEVIPELERGEYYLAAFNNPARDKKIKTSIPNTAKLSAQTIIGFPEMADRLAVIKDGFEPVVIETLKSFLLTKAAENYPEKEINAWYHNSSSSGIEFHLDGIRKGEVAVMRIPLDTYEKTLSDYRKHPKKDIYKSLYAGSYLSVQNLLRPDIIK